MPHTQTSAMAVSKLKGIINKNHPVAKMQENVKISKYSTSSKMHIRNNVESDDEDENVKYKQFNKLK